MSEETSPEPDEHGRIDPPMHVGEAATSAAFLDFHRATFAWKCAGLDADALRTTVGASSMTLGGMLKHLTIVEISWFPSRLLGEDPGAPWDTVDWTADPDWEWNSAGQDTPDELRAMWQGAVDRSRSALAKVLTDGGLDRRARIPLRDGSRPSARWILCHMIEEYARHNGHADLIRESIDGVTGE